MHAIEGVNTALDFEDSLNIISHVSSGGNWFFSNLFEEDIAALSDDDLRRKTSDFRVRLDNASEFNKQLELLDELLPEVFAMVREASKRVLGMRHFDVQLIGGMVLHEGQIAEMKTGEGKTLVSTLPVYLNSLTAFFGFKRGLFQIKLDIAR